MSFDINNFNMDNFKKTLENIGKFFPDKTEKTESLFKKDEDCYISGQYFTKKNGNYVKKMLELMKKLDDMYIFSSMLSEIEFDSVEEKFSLINERCNAIANKNVDKVDGKVLKSITKSFEKATTEFGTKVKLLDKKISDYEISNGKVKFDKSSEKVTIEGLQTLVSEARYKELIDAIGKLDDNFPKFEDKKFAGSTPKETTNLKNIDKIKQDLKDKKLIEAFLEKEIKQLEKLSKKIYDSPLQFGIFKKFGVLARVTHQNSSKDKIRERIKDYSDTEQKILDYYILDYEIRQFSIDKITNKLDIIFKKTFGNIFENSENLSNHLKDKKAKKQNIADDNKKEFDDNWNKLLERIEDLKQYYSYFLACTKYMPKFEELLDASKSYPMLYKDCKTALTQSQTAADKINAYIEKFSKEMDSYSKLKKATTNFKEVKKEFEKLQIKYKEMTRANDCVSLLLRKYGANIKYSGFGPLVAENIDKIKYIFNNAILGLNIFNKMTFTDLADLNKRTKYVQEGVLNQTFKNLDKLKPKNSFPPFYPADSGYFSKENLKSSIIYSQELRKPIPEILKNYVSEKKEAEKEDYINAAHKLSIRYNIKKAELEQQKKEVKKIKITSKIFNLNNLRMVVKLVVILVGILSVVL